MKKCMTCQFALFDGYCLAYNKYTLLDSEGCLLHVEKSKEVETENEALRKKLELTKRMYVKANEEKCITAVENVKLRGLVTDLLHGARGPCKRCFNYDQCLVTADGCKFWQIVEGRAQELGIEVNDD